MQDTPQKKRWFEQNQSMDAVKNPQPTADNGKTNPTSPTKKTNETSSTSKKKKS